MTGAIAFYFPAVVITLVIAGVLAWIAWQHPPLPGVHAFALMGLDVLLMAMIEILSMISPQQDQALFWFNVRSLFISILPVLYVIFAVRYHGHGAWFSPRVLAALFVIPVITQLVIWVPAWHSLWAIEDVIFVRTGEFWVSLDATLIPGAWYLVDAIYSLLLLFMAASVMLLAAWNKKGRNLGQSLLLSAGAVVGIMLALVPLFDLLPNANFNILIPGLGVIALLYALAVFRFRLLKTSIPLQLFSEEDKLKSQDKRSLAFILVVFAITSTGIATIGYFSYTSYTAQLQHQAEHQLDSIAQLKIDGLADWRYERQGDAIAISQNPAFPILIESYLKDPEGTETSEVLQSWLDILRTSYQYARVLFIDSEGFVRLSSPKNELEVPPLLLEYINGSFQTREVTWLDFHQHEDQSIHLTMIAPIFSVEDLNRPLGFVVFNIDPSTWLYPYLQEWPTVSETAETLLIRQEGDEVVFLNPARFNPEAALNMRFPLTQSQMIAVKAILGTMGIVEGLDYRGQPVVGVVYEVPDTPWILVARMDKAEIYAPARTRLWQTVVFFGFLILALGSSLGLFWRGNRIRVYKEKLNAAEALRRSEEKFRKAFNTYPDAVLISHMEDGKIVSVNEGFTKTLGYTSEEIIGMTTLELALWVDKRDRERLLSKLQKKDHVNGFEAKFRKKNKGIIDGLTSTAIIEINETHHVLTTIRDITVQKASEQKILKYSSHLEEMVEERTRELKKAQERLLRQERLAALGQLAGSIAHELRNPLGVISNATTYLSMIQPEADEKVREYIEIIKNETRTSEKIISDLIDYSKLQTVERKPAEIAEIIRNAQRRNPAPGYLKVSTVAPTNLPHVLVNATQIEQAIGNLLTNAYQAMPTAGDLLIKAELSRESGEEECVKITVKDNGEGIAAEDMDKIFEPLFTTKVKGMGLGLAVSKKIIDANQGHIEVESHPGKGSTFTLLLPIHKGAK